MSYLPHARRGEIAQLISNFIKLENFKIPIVVLFFNCLTFSFFRKNEEIRRISALLSFPNMTFGGRFFGFRTISNNNI